MLKWTITGFIATLIIVLSLPLYAWLEPGRMQQSKTTLLHQSIAAGETIYAENCVVCHGSDGQGIGAYPDLTNDGVRQMDYEDLYKVIERGRYNTAMAAWGVDEGGVLDAMQIDQLIAMIRQGDWTDTAQTVERSGLAPPALIKVEITAEMLASLADLPKGDLIVRALPLYAANCTGCHGAQAEGTAIAPALNDPELLARRSDADLQRAITDGVSGTLMAGWNQVLTPQEIDDLVGLIRTFDQIPTDLLPEPVLPTIASTDAGIIAAGENLYKIACTNCHGSNGQGTPMAPALNSQSFLSATSDQAIKAIISQGVPDTRMPAWGGRLSDAELNSLVSFLRSWGPTAPAVVTPTDSGVGGGPPWMR